MLNQIILVGRLVEDPITEELYDGRTKTEITLAVQRSFKNPETLEYDTDFIKCILWQGIAESTVRYCRKGSTVGIKGRLTCLDRFQPAELIAEKISFINT